MTREEALLKLLALGPLQFPELVAITGWGENETNDVMRRLMVQERIDHHHLRSGCGPLLFFVPERPPYRKHLPRSIAIADQP